MSNEEYFYKFLKDFKEITPEINTLKYCPNHMGHGSLVYLSSFKFLFTPQLDKVRNHDLYRIPVSEIKPLIERLDKLFFRKSGGKPLKFRNIRYVDILTCVDFYRVDKDYFLCCSNFKPLWWRNMVRENLRDVKF